jgi:RHS repeat-associated protein
MTRIRVVWMTLALVLVSSTSFAQGGETVVYFHADAVGSTRLVTDANGAVVERHDYLPFGEPWASSGLETRRFGGKERDTETGLDYFGARYYSSLNGRFTAVDPILDIESAIVDPQRWNRYAYAYNHPFRFMDPDGRQGLSIGLEGDYQAWVRGKISDAEYRARAQEHAKAGSLTLGIGAAVGALVAGGPSAWRSAVGCFLSPACQGVAVDTLEGLAGAAPRITPTGDIDPAAMALARRLGGQASVAIEGFAREFDAVSGQYVAQTFGGRSALLKPGNFLSSSRREQIRATLQAAKATGRKAYFEFTDGVHDDVIQFIRRNAERVGVEYVIGQ